MLMKRVIAAGGIVLNDKREIALVKSKKGYWGFPKGHIERGEKPIDAAIREIYEECGARDLILVKKLGKVVHLKPFADRESSKPFKKYIVFYLFKTEQKELKPQDSEISEAQWVDLERAVDLLKYDVDRAFLMKNISKL